jgi:hypothetical protein
MVEKKNEARDKLPKGDFFQAAADIVGVNYAK